MPGVLHQGILELFCDDPWLAFDLLHLPRPGSGTPIDRRSDRSDVEHFDEQTGRLTIGLPDLVLCTSDGRVVICVEAQRKQDLAKRHDIPFYQAALAKRHKSPTWVVVVSFSPAFSRDIRRWSKGSPPRVDVLLLDADTVLVSLEAALARPTAAVLAGALHGCRGNLRAAQIGIQACELLPPDKRLSYTRTILAALSKKKRALLQKELTVEQQDKLWDIERRSGTYLKGVEHGREEGWQEGREEGWQEGQREGRREALLELIFAVLEVRAIPMDAVDEARVRDCAQLELLQSWARRAREVEGISELFEPI